MWPYLIAPLVVLVAIAWVGLRRTNELCALELSQDGARLVRGRAPSRFLADAAEIARRSGSPRVLVRVVSESSEPRLLAPSRLPAGTTQALRNVVGQHRVVHFRTGKRPAG